MPRSLEEIGFRDRVRAVHELDALREALPRGILARIEKNLSGAADPDGALALVTRFFHERGSDLERIARSPSGIQALIAVFSHSGFLSEELLRRPEWLDDLLASGGLRKTFTTDDFRAQLDAFVEGVAPAQLALYLSSYRRRQLLRILLRDVMGKAALAETAAEISYLADAILDIAYRRVREQLVAAHGVPQYTGPDGERRVCSFSILSLGKLGGQELNYSSDIDLMFVFSGAGETSGPDSISNTEFFQKVANLYTDLLSTYTAEGLCYRVDLRLRPDGRLGEVAISLDGARKYYRNRARDWELQMLIKARISAGEPEPGEELLQFVEPLIYSSSTDFAAIEAVSEARQRINEKLAAKRDGAAFDIKLAPGGIRDIEFLVQCLQRLHGGREPWVRHGGTMLALTRLHDKDLLSSSEFSALTSAYQFLRHLEHRLQVEEDRQTHALPASQAGLESLARRMPAPETGANVSADRLRQQLNLHLERVLQIYERVIHAQKPVYYGIVAAAEDHQPEIARAMFDADPEMAQGRPKRGAVAFERFLASLPSNTEWMRWLNEDPTLAGHARDVFENSPWLAEQLVRSPELLSEVRGMREMEPGSPMRTPQPPFDAAALRRFYRRELVRLECESLCLRTPIFEILARTSDLADTVIAAAYSMAVEQTAAAHPPRQVSYQPATQMVVVALGRLGMREFDLASDADLVFVIPDSESGEVVFWTHVAERLIDILTAYTGDGAMFAVDTRLRPSGREGELVQAEHAYKYYFERHAEAWEGIAYMKARAICGDQEFSNRFLHELQEVDWRRYGQSGRSRKKLHQMRMRLEKEQGTENPLKASIGGYYDIDFALMYLRLKSAGIFFHVLNTPERIDIVEKMGHLERADAVFLRDAATLFRAVEHGIRLLSGQAGGRLPTSRAHLEQLTEMVMRWTPSHLHDQPLERELAQIRERTRDYFDRLFG